VWAQYRDPYRPEALARLFDRTAAPLGPAFRLHSPDNAERYVERCAATYDVELACVAAGWAGGTWVVTWVGTNGSIWDHPPRTETLYVRRFSG
jgi:hypothetical protein